MRRGKVTKSKCKPKRQLRNSKNTATDIASIAIVANSNHSRTRLSRSSAKGSSKEISEATGKNASLKGEKSLCFQDAIQAREDKKISEAVYFSQLLAHYGGERHPDDDKMNSAQDLVFAQTKTEEVAYHVRLTSLAEGYEAFSPSEVQLSEHLFQSCVDDKIDLVKCDLEKLQDRRSLLIQPLAALAAKSNHNKMFQFCFKEAQELGLDITFPLNRAVFQMPTTLDFLLEQNWENVQNSPKALEMFMYSSLLTCADHEHPADVLRWTLAHGVKVPKDEYRHMAESPPRTDVLEILLVGRCELIFL